MKKFKCEYENGADLNIDTWQMEISATRAQNAYDQFITLVGAHQNKVFVYEANQIKGGFYDPDIFEGHIIDLSEEWITNATNANDYLDNKKNDGYFKLEAIEKIKAQLYFESLIDESGRRILHDEEIQYLKLWLGFKDRELGQTLLAQAEAKKPAAQRGKTQLTQTILAGIIAGNMAKTHELRELNELNESVDEIAEDVEDVSGGFEG